MTFQRTPGVKGWEKNPRKEFDEEANKVEQQRMVLMYFISELF